MRNLCFRYSRRLMKQQRVPLKLDEKLARLGLARPIDFVLHLPLRYEDETRLERIADCAPGDTTQVQGRVVAVDVQYRPRRQLVVRIDDDSGELLLRFLNFYGSQITVFERARDEHAVVRARGEVRRGFGSHAVVEMVHPKTRVVDESAPLPTTLTPIYPAGEGISQTTLRKRIDAALAHVALDEVLPDTLAPLAELMPLEQAVRTLHQPPRGDEAALIDKTHPAWTRIKFEELLAQQLALRRARARRHAKRSPIMRPGVLVERLRAALPFKLTRAQERVSAEIAADLQRAFPMTRLLQGDVGAGKTVVAALAAAQAIDAGWQAALMAPTELLAEQHFRKIAQLLEPLGVTVAWLTGSLKTREKRAALDAIASGAAPLAIGTHALFQDRAEFARLGLAIVDEQHRFGVAQRLALRAKTSSEVGMLEPHQLMMSATPIPRTLAMTYLADLDVSVIDELPPGRTPIRTHLVDDARRDEVIARVREAVHAGRQAYWVCPLIEENPEGSGPTRGAQALELQTAIDTHARLSAELSELKVGLVHGRLPTAEKQAVMDAFARNEVHVLVATTVIEVGVDVPNASLMVVEHAERFGLAQLHQLRGRVGRGAAASACVLMYAKPLSNNAKQRLRTLYETTDGFEIARRDLELRGPGEFLGARQSGAPLLRFADLELDAELVEQARDAAAWLIEHAPHAARAHLERWHGGREEFLKA
ncbi:MAG TPA: ATP-dependent DNA helicase RecG [Burkholderiaceae bacterium]|nr:ATP-dependent DNA helicase RecG [Burkholderiaceae bacterium]